MRDYHPIFNNLPVITTDRLILRKIEPSDIDDIFEFTSDIEMTKLSRVFNLTKTKEEVSSYINSIIECYALSKVAPWVIVYKDTCKVIGVAGFWEYVPHALRAEIGYAVARPFWGRGIATEVSKAIIAFGFEYLNLYRVQAICDPNNIGSLRVMEKCYMQYEGLLRNYTLVNDKSYDRKIYSITRSEFLKIYKPN